MSKQDNSYSTEREKHVRQTALKALKEMSEQPEELQVAARRLRQDLFSWLIGIEGACSSLANVVQDDLANNLCDSLLSVAGRQDGKAWGTFCNALNALDDTQQLDLANNALTLVLSTLASNTPLISFNPNRSIWEQVGFCYDPQLLTLFVSVGANPAQPVGFCDDEFYVSTEGAKLLWARKFAILAPLPYNGPFKVTMADIKQDPKGTFHHGTPEARQLSMFEIEESLLALRSSSVEPDDVLKAVEALKLARCRVPALEQHCNQILDDRPELGANFENANLQDVLGSFLEFLRALSDDQQIQQKLRSTQLTLSSEESPKARIHKLLGYMSRNLPLQGQAPDDQRLKQVVTNVLSADASLISLMEELEEEPPLSQVEKLMLHLHKVADTL